MDGSIGDIEQRQRAMLGCAAALEEGLHEGAGGIGAFEVVAHGVGAAGLTLHRAIQSRREALERGDCFGVAGERAISPRNRDMLPATQASDTKATHGAITPGASARTNVKRPRMK